MTDIYWAANSDVDTFASELTKRIVDYYEFLNQTGRATRAKRAWNTFYGYSPDGTRDTMALTPGGEGELVNMNTNHFAALLNQAVVMTTSNRPAFKANAVANTFKDKAHAQVAEGILDHYDRNLFLHEKDTAVAFRAVLTGEGYGAVHWDTSQGDESADPDSGEVIKDGDIDVTVHTLFDVAYDCGSEDFSKVQWIAIRRPVSRHDLAAMYPHKADYILSAAQNKDTDYNFNDFRWNNFKQEKKDYVDLWEFRHIPSPALPGGRLVRLINQKCVVYDTHTDLEGNPRAGHYPYGKGLRVRRMQPDEIVGGSGGHTAFFDLLSQQEGIDLVATIMASTVNTSGAANLYVTRGANISIDALAGGFNIIQGDTPEAPKPVDTAHVSKETLDFASMCVQWMRQRTALNDVVMGEPTKGMPAQAMALMHAQALQFHSKYQESYQRYTEGVRTDIIEVLKMYANTTRVAYIAGPGGQWKAAEFSKKDIASVSHVYVEQLSAAAKSFPGRMSMAKDMIDMGLINQPEQYIDLVSSGQLKPLYESQEANLMRIAAEKDLLRKGIGLPPVDQMGNFVDDGQPHVWPLMSDTHWLDIPEYLAVVNTPEARADPQVVQAVMGVVMWKLDAWRAMDPALIALYKGMMPPPRVDPAMLGPAGLAGPAANTNEQPPGNPANTNLELPEGVKNPNLPKTPPNPLTGTEGQAPQDL